jgi:hypothetical protein
MQLWTLSEQHARRVEELEAELKQKASQVAALRADAAKVRMAVDPGLEGLGQEAVVGSYAMRSCRSL